MKKLALVLGSLLVIGSAASAKEVMPAPMPEPEVKIVEKPVEVIVYRDRVVQAPAKWKPNGFVGVELRTQGKVENKGKKATEENARKGWAGKEPNVRLETKASVNFTENQNLEVRTRQTHVLTKTDSDKEESNHKDTQVRIRHTYNFGKLGSSKVGFKVASQYLHDDHVDSLRTRAVFDFADYIYSNSLFKTTALEIGPSYKYVWGGNDDRYYNALGLYANAEFELPYGFGFQAEFEDAFTYTSTGKGDGKRDKAKLGHADFVLSHSLDLYKEGKHSLAFLNELEYETFWAWDKKDASMEEWPHVDGHGRVNSEGKNKKWGAYELTYTPKLQYNYQATEFVKLYAAIGGEYVNRENNKSTARYWRWNPTAWAGMKVTF
ncbi:MAG: porin [Fusobacterium necrophorum]|nr:porin [Fusobacterium necrophorum]